MIKFKGKTEWQNKENWHFVIVFSQDLKSFFLSIEKTWKKQQNPMNKN